MEKGNQMNDPFLKLLGWLTPLLQREWSGLFAPGTPEYAILDELRQGWGKMDTAELLKRLSEKHGPMAAATVEMFVAACIKEDWANVGAKEAQLGTEIEDFMRILWVPLLSEGFSFTQNEADGRVELRVTKCPVYELAERTKMHAWLYHLACATDFYTAVAFSPRIMFTRTKTLMEGHGCCNHTYFYKAE
jgi:predicted ArsR family transcriptional regulator